MTARRAPALALLAACTLAPHLPARAQDAPPRRGFSIQITSPKNQEVVFGKTKITATVRAENPDAVESVEFLVADKVIFVDREAPYECFFDFGEASKSWIVRAIAHHREGITVSDTVVTRKVILSYVEEVNRIVLWASVTDKNDQFVTDLKREDFRILEDGKEQEILEFYVEDRPITLAILLDTSGSMREQMKEVHAAAGSFVDTVREQDRAMIVTFDDKVFLIQDLTADKTALKSAIVSTEAIGATAIYDALHAAYRKLRGIQGRKAIVLLTDGDDTSSQFGFERILEEAKSENVIVYAIGLGGSFGPGRTVIKEFPEETGGRSFFVKKASDLGETYERIAEELRKQYAITYSTPIQTWDGRWIRVEVKTRNEKLKVNARRGYFAVRPQGLRSAAAN